MVTKRRSWAFCGLIVWQLAASGFSAAFMPAKADPTDLYPPLGDFALREPPLPPPPGGPKIYSTTGANPAWLISQWNIVGGKLSPFVVRQSGDDTIYESSAAAASVTVVKIGGQSIVTLAQNGAPVPCLSANGRPRESDLLASSLHRMKGAAPGERANYNLTDLNSLREVATVTVEAGPSTPSKGCLVSRAGVLVALILTDNETLPRQTLFYQFWISRYCLADAPGSSCPAPLQQQSIFSRRNPFGVDDGLIREGQPGLANGETRSLDVDLLPRLKLAVENGPAAMDRDWSHWAVTGGYFGLGSWGDVTLKSTWQNYRLIADIK